MGVSAPAAPVAAASVPAAASALRILGGKRTASDAPAAAVTKKSKKHE
jgi:hypothetical protein